VYSYDRTFVYFELQDEKYDEELKKVRHLSVIGHPVIIIRLENKYDIGQEMMRWELATATAGAVLGINAFDQPNVQESKDNTNKLLQAVVEEGELPDPEPGLSEDDEDIFLDAVESDLQEVMSRFLGKARDGDYVAIQAYVTEEPDTGSTLQTIRLEIRSRLKAATTVGYGPRFLHSTGQYHKGGPNTGLFIQLVTDVDRDADIPGEPYSFGVLRAAQAQGDLQALREHDRRVVRIDLGHDIATGLDKLRESLAEPVHHEA
jgi:hypothetical protein